MMTLFFVTDRPHIISFCLCAKKLGHHIYLYKVNIYILFYISHPNIKWVYILNKHWNCAGILWHHIQITVLSYDIQICLFVCLFVCFESHEQFFSYLATVTITRDRAENLDLCLALTAFSSEDSFTCHTYCDMGPPFLRSYPKDPWFYLLNAVLLAKEQSPPI
jgi:hypothetical protein